MHVLTILALLLTARPIILVIWAVWSGESMWVSASSPGLDALSSDWGRLGTLPAELVGWRHNWYFPRMTGNEAGDSDGSSAAILNLPLFARRPRRIFPPSSSSDVGNWYFAEDDWERGCVGVTGKPNVTRWRKKYTLQWKNHAWTKWSWPYQNINLGMSLARSYNFGQC